MPGVGNGVCEVLATDDDFFEDLAARSSNAFFFSWSLAANLFIGQKAVHLNPFAKFEGVTPSYHTFDKILPKSRRVNVLQVVFLCLLAHACL